ncbi:MAG: hypothetical protein LCH53_13710 [Bacteroidetes bacterium]|nr:hypothetical protein [Bacteroidota bacterium]
MPTFHLHYTEDEVEARLAELEAQKRPCTECGTVTNRGGYMNARRPHMCEACWEAASHDESHLGAYRAGMPGASPSRITDADRQARQQALTAYAAACSDETCPECGDEFPRHPDGPRQCPACVAYLLPY